MVVSEKDSKENMDLAMEIAAQCWGEAIGDRAYTADDGSVRDSVLCAKIPEIVEADYVNGGQ